MTYKINPEVEKILSPIKLVFEDGTSADFSDGKTLAAAVFDKHYNIVSYCVKDKYLEITVVEFVEMNKKRG